MGITKGAASQTLARLQKKGLIGAESDPYNKNQLQMEPTRSGRAAMSAFQQRFQKEWRDLSDYLDKLNDREHRTVGGFLDELERFLKGMA